MKRVAPRTLVVILGLASLGACSTPPAEESPQPAAPTPEPVVEGAPAPAEEPELLPSARSPEEGVLSGGQPTLEHLDRLAEAGYATVVNLRAPEEEGQLAAEEYTSRGFEYAVLPIAGADGITAENAAALAEWIADASKRPIVVHCGSGNRVGALLALDAHASGRSPEEALAFGLENGLTRLEPVVRERIGLPPAGAEGDPAENSEPSEDSAD